MIAYVCVGISASGKSTFASKLLNMYEIVEVNRDMLRMQYSNNVLNEQFSWKNWNFNNEHEITKMQLKSISDCALLHNDVIISDTNLIDDYRNSLVEFLINSGYTVCYLIFNIDLNEAISRDSSRELSVGCDVITTQYEQFLIARNLLMSNSHNSILEINE